MRNYEIMFIVNPNVAEDEIDKINAQIESIVTTGGGTVAKVEKMGKRRLAYPWKSSGMVSTCFSRSPRAATSLKKPSAGCASWIR